jgi:hypothetical protein
MPTTSPVLGAVLLAAASMAWGAEPGGSPAPALAPTRPVLEVPWSEGPARPFVAAVAEVGTTQHLRVMGGWGQPHWLWAGLLADGWINGDVAIGTLGARAVLRAVNLDVHWRVTRNWSRVAMATAPRHDALATGRGSTLHAWDLDAWGGLPTPGGFLLWEAQATRLLGLSRDLDVFDEGVHGIVRGPWSGLVALGWVADLLGGDLQVGAGCDLAFLGRGDARRLRVGPQGSWTISRRWSLRGQVLVPVSGPDHLPLGPSLGGGLAIQWRDATGPDTNPPPPRPVTPPAGGRGST